MKPLKKSNSKQINQMRIYTIALVFCFFTLNSFSQIYNYNPINFHDLETNPALLASESSNKSVRINQQIGLSNFSSSSVGFSKYIPRSFIGIGLILNHTSLNDSINYTYSNLGIGYRNKLFDLVSIKFGLNYKLIQTNSPVGNFDYFSFTARNSDNISSHSILSNNVNASIYLSDGTYNLYYLSYALLNMELPFSLSKDTVQFPSYQVVNIGNFINLFSRDPYQELSYTGFIKTNGKTTFSHYVNFKLMTPINRKSSFIYGTKIGYTINSYYHFIPFIGFFTRNLIAELNYNFHLDSKSFISIYNSTSQLKLSYRLPSKKSNYSSISF